MPNGCSYLLYRETNDPPQPAEHCENEAEEGEDFCKEHLAAEDESEFWREFYSDEQWIQACGD